MPATPGSQLKKILTDALGVLAVVDKQREIYYIENIKIHIDIVENLGSFVEIEASDQDTDITVAQLHKQCEELMKAMQIDTGDLESRSYSDLMLTEETDG